MGLGHFYEDPAIAGCIQPARRTEFTAGPTESLTSCGTKGPSHRLSQEGVAFHQEPDLRWSRREVKLLCGFEQIT